ncbi:MAG: hypothetical protein Q9218_007870 [Villophora microphyllina]
MLTACVSMGLGKHTFAINPNLISYVVKLYLIAIPFAVFTLTLPGIAVAILLDHLIVPTRKQQWVLYGVPILQVIVIAVDVVLVFAQCSPTSTLWDPKPGARCWNREVMAGYIYFNSSYSAFTDVFLAVVPIVAFWQLQIKPKAKIVLYLLMSSTTVLEGNAIIIAACIPGLRPFVKYIREKYFHRKGHRPAPLMLHKDHHLSSVTSGPSVPSTPISPRRMEPRSSGSISSVGLKLPNHKVYRQRSLAPILSNADYMDFEGYAMQQEGSDVENQRSDAGDSGKREERQISEAQTLVERSG